MDSCSEVVKQRLILGARPGDGTKGEHAHALHLVRVKLQLDEANLLVRVLLHAHRALHRIFEECDMLFDREDLLLVLF